MSCENVGLFSLSKIPKSKRKERCDNKSVYEINVIVASRSKRTICVCRSMANVTLPNNVLDTIYF